MHQRAASLLTNHGGTVDADASYKETTQEIASGNGPSALLAQFRASERAVLAALGPSQARAFAESIERLLGGA